MNFQLEHSELKECYFQVVDTTQDEELPSVHDRVQNCRPAMSPLLLRQNDELNHLSVNGSALHTSEIASSF